MAKEAEAVSNRFGETYSASASISGVKGGLRRQVTYAAIVVAGCPGRLVIAVYLIPSDAAGTYWRFVDDGVLVVGLWLAFPIGEYADVSPTS